MIEKNSKNYENISFDISGYIVEKKTIYEAKLTPDLQLDSKNKIIGFYDQSLRTGIIRISKDFINKSGISYSKNPYIYLKIEKSESLNNIIKYKRISLIASILENNSKICVSQISYQFGSLDINENERKFKLKINKLFKYMNLQFSCLDETLLINLEGVKNNLQIKSDNYGKKIYSIECSEFGDKEINELIIKRNRTDTNNKLEYFTFQYTFSNSTDIIYTIKNNTLEVEKRELNNKVDYNIKLFPVDNYQKYNITYILKLGGLKKNKNDIKYIPKKEYITIQNEEQIVKEFYNPELLNEMINLSIININSLISYIQVIAQIQDKETIEYLSYKLYYLSNEENKSIDNKNDNNNNGSNIFLIIVLILIGIIICLIILFLAFNLINKKKDLLNNIDYSFNQKDRNSTLMKEMIEDK